MSFFKRYIAESINDTNQISQKIISQFINNTYSNVITLTGDLGSGKTTLCRYIICNFLQIEIDVISPTFNILKTYTNNNKKVYHYDFYRINSPEEISELAIEEALNTNLTLIEWPSIATTYIPKSHIKILIKIRDLYTREIMVEQ